MRINGRRPGRFGPLRGTRRARKGRRLLDRINAVTLEVLGDSAIPDFFFKASPLMEYFRSRGIGINGGETPQESLRYED